VGRLCWPICALEANFLLPDALLSKYGQVFAVKVGVHQREVRAQPVMVLRDASVANLVETEDAPQYMQNVSYLCYDSRLRRALTFGYFVYIVFELRPTTSHILLVWSGFCD